MGISERKERDREEMKRLILETALAIYKEEGFEHVTIRNITERMEYSPRTLYLYFKDKDQILFALHNQGFNELYTRQLTLVSIKDPGERLAAHGRLYIKFALENPELYDLMFIAREPFVCIEDLGEWQMAHRAFEVLMDNVLTCMDAGLMPRENPQIPALAIWSFVHGLAALIIRRKMVMLPAEYQEQIFAEVLRFMSGRLVGKP
jgi:AcrR family transcriptional regulator